MSAARLTVVVSTRFLGQLEGNPSTGIVRITNAYPAGVYTIRTRAFDSGGASTTDSFQLTVTTPLTCNPVSLAPSVNYATANSPRSVAVADFNLDGKQDLAVANFAFATGISILLGNGQGGFAPASSFNIGAHAAFVNAGDFNGDGEPDLSIIRGVPADVVIYLGNGTGGFSIAGPAVPVGGDPLSSAVADFNGDGKQDIAVANDFSNIVSILLGSGTGTFSSPTNFPAGNGTTSIAVGDFNGDSTADLVVTNYDSQNLGSISTLLGNGIGGFGIPTSYSVGKFNGGVAIGDFNGDGKQDLAVANSSNDISILLGNGTGSFGPPNNFPAGQNPFSVAAGDFNGDGKQDIAVVNLSGNNVSILTGDGTGSFGSAANFNVGTTPGAIALGDFNGDGKQDMATANMDSNNISVLLRNCTGHVIDGTITYGNATGAPTPRFVSNVTVTGSGSTAVSTTTAPPGLNAGQYALSGFGTGSYTLTPTKLGAINGSITSFDAGRIAQHVAGVNVLTGNQFVVADVSGNGTLSSFDAGQIARYVAGVPGSGSTGIWRFNPVNRTYPTITTNISGEDYSALLMGEVSGNWNNTGARPIGGKPLAIRGGPERGVALELPDIKKSVSKDIVVPVNIQGAAAKGVISYEFDLRFDPSIIQPKENPVDLIGTVSRGLTTVANGNQPGLLRVVVYGPMPIDGDGVLLNLSFMAVGKPGSVSPLTWERIMFNEGEPRVSTTDGQIELF